MRNSVSLAFAIGFLASTAAFATAQATTVPSQKPCWVDAKTGKQVPAPSVNATTAKVSEQKLVRVACPPAMGAAEQKSVPVLLGLWLKAPPLLTKAPAAPAWWVSAEALIWTVKSSRLPPTLTTFTPGSPSATTGFGGELGVPGTIILSPSSLNYDTLPGGRFGLGHWLDPAESLGLEVEGFLLGSKSAGFSDSSGGTPPLRVPFTNVPPGAGFPLGASSFVLADPGFAAGGQVINQSLQFWGVEANALLRGFEFRPVDARPITVSLLSGVRYLNLGESLTITSTENEFAPPGGSFTGTDSFATRNQFIGAQIGAKAEAQLGQFDGMALAKVAFGDNYQTVTINGTSSASGFGFPTSVSSLGGIFAQTTNIGRQNRNQFAVLPEVEVQLGYKLPYGVRLFVGYDFLYLSNVVRPGDQIDTTINLTSNSVISGAGSTLVGAARPMPLFNTSSFWAQGLNLGASYAF